MATIFDAVPFLAAYSVSFLVLAAIALMTLIQNFATAPLAFVNEEQVPGLPLRFDHSKLSFRAVRTYSNSAETFPAFGWAVLMAISSGAWPLLVNWLAIGYFIARVAFWVIYYAGIGKPAGGPRTMAFVAGLLCNIALACMAAWSLAKVVI
ncbi:MAPEG family protein [uncultured Tateyamaria sp.]|uniref:MAPEG family protein n=1 Tax=uncultured Tateyamaria sp. TaxID=455651 RepID=UPI00262254D5|nr:MAPEG family protein [uncultured Tateyamaria sp.]